MQNSKLKGRIITALRKLTYSVGFRTAALRRAKVAPATYKCEYCSKIVYTGKKELDKVKELEQFDNPIKGKVQVDHEHPVIPINGFKNTDWDWNEYMDRLFCPAKDLNVLCTDCHSKKTKEENKQRKAYRDSKKEKK